MSWPHLTWDDVLSFHALMIVVGYLGQAMFGSRFLVQWIATERRRRVTVPMAFWYLSIGGTLLLMSWAVYRLDPVLIPGFSLNLIIYLRNVYHGRRVQARMHRVRPRAQRPAPTEPPAPPGNDG
jgi:lipid-A-disaccharide synthase-like uncharacterized protein